MLAAQDELELSAALELSVEAGGVGLLELGAEPTAVEDTPTGGLLPRVQPRVLPPPPDEDVPEPPVFERGEVRGASRRRRPSTTRPSCSTHSPRVLRRARGHQARDVGSFYSR